MKADEIDNIIMEINEIMENTLNKQKIKDFLILDPDDHTEFQKKELQMLNIFKRCMCTLKLIEQIPFLTLYTITEEKYEIFKKNPVLFFVQKENHTLLKTALILFSNGSLNPSYNILRSVYFNSLTGAFYNLIAKNLRFNPSEFKKNRNFLQDQGLPSDENTRKFFYEMLDKLSDSNNKKIFNQAIKRYYTTQKGGVSFDLFRIFLNSPIIKEIWNQLLNQNMRLYHKNLIKCLNNWDLLIPLGNPNDDQLTINTTLEYVNFDMLSAHVHERPLLQDVIKEIIINSPYDEGAKSRIKEQREYLRIYLNIVDFSMLITLNSIKNDIELSIYKNEFYEEKEWLPHSYNLIYRKW